MAAASPRKPAPRMDPGTALEVLSKLEPVAAAKVLGVLEADAAAEMLEGALRFKRWDLPRVAALMSACPPAPAARILGLMTDAEAVKILETMDTRAASAVVDRLGALAAGYLLRMDATAAVKAVRRSEQTEEQFFPSAEQQKEYQARVKVVDSMQKDIEGVEWFLFQAEQTSRGRLRLLDDRGRWEPFTRDGLAGWLLILVITLAPLLLLYVTSVDLVQVGKDVGKLIEK